ncbi:MAG: SDR family oxidoreductase [Bacteriovoracaceae bacterium]
MKILLTGSTGFIGKRLTESLVSKGHEVYCLVRPQSLEKAKELFSDTQVQFVTGDLTKNDVLDSVSEAETVMNTIEAVIHLAATYDLAVNQTEAYLSNVVGTQNLLFLLQRMKKLQIFHYMSTYTVSGVLDGEFLEEDLDPGRPFRDHYSQTKMQAELLVRNTRMPTVALRIYRPGIVIGDSKTGKMEKIDGPYYFFRVFQGISRYIKHVPINILPVYYHPQAILPFIPVNVLVQWLTEMIDRPTHHMTRTYHLVPEEKIFIGPMIEETAKYFGLNIKVQRVPMPSVMKRVFPLLKVPSQMDAYFLNNTRYSMANVKTDYPNLRCPQTSEYLPVIMAGAKELLT